jgi:hypothetical protein
LENSRFVVTFCIIVLNVCLTCGCGHGTEKSSEVTVANGGFESGKLEPWAPFQSVQAAVDTTQVYAGKFSLGESTAPGSVYQDVRGLVPAASYLISARVSWSPGASATAQIAVFDPAANIATFSSAISPAPGWQSLNYEFKLSANSQGLVRIHLFRNGGNGTVFWDDVQIARTQ